jgi:hypothetical protein
MNKNDKHKEIKDRVIFSQKFDWRKLKPFQPENLKSMEPVSFEKLKNSIINSNFIQSFDVWKEDDDNYWIIDGHHRMYALQELEKEGYSIPDKFQCTFIDCKDKQDACYAIITKASSHARITELGFTEFVNNNDLDYKRLIESIDIPSFNIEDILKDIKIDNENLNEEYKSQFKVEVECEDESDQEAIYKLMISKGYKCRILSM